MKRSLAVLLFVSIVALGLVIYLLTTSEDRSIRLADRATIPFARMTEELRGPRVIFVGEDHDNPWHHQVQLAVIRDLNSAGVSLAIGLEMFTAKAQEHLDRWLAGQLDDRAFIHRYYDEWRMPWSLYRDIFQFAKANRIPLVGLNVPREITAKVAKEGFKSLLQAERRHLPPAITCDIDSTYMQFVKQAYSFHDTDAKAFLHFCEAQMVWDKSMAWHLGRYLEQHPERIAVVIAGSGHSLRAGMPDELPGLGHRIVIPQSPLLKPAQVSARDADYLVLQGRRSRR